MVIAEERTREQISLIMKLVEAKVRSHSENQLRHGIRSDLGKHSYTNTSRTN